MPLGETTPKTHREELLETVWKRVSEIPDEPRMVVISIASALIESVKMNGPEGFVALALCSAQLAVEIERGLVPLRSPTVIPHPGKVVH